MPDDRSILHVDMDAFFAAVEELDDPGLRGRPLLVGGDGPRGVVSTASYAARAYGCHSAQPMSIARRLCPHAVVIRGRMGRYQEVSAALFRLFESVTPAVEPLSVDEAFLDLTGTRRLHGDPVAAARALKARVRGEIGLTASVGVAPNKFLAKLASDLEKPDGLTVITAATADDVLPPLPVTRIWGVGPKTAAKLFGRGIRTIGDLRRAPAGVIEGLLGSDAARCRRLAMGVDDRPVTPDAKAKSIGHEQTFGHDVTDPDAVRATILAQAEAVGARLRRAGVRARTVVVKIRFGDFQTVTRSRSLDEPTDATDAVWRAARGLFDAWAAGGGFRPVRLIGTTTKDIAGPEPQLALFGNERTDRRRALDAAVDQINRKFGKRAVRRAGPGI